MRIGYSVWTGLHMHLKNFLGTKATFAQQWLIKNGYKNGFSCSVLHCLHSSVLLIKPMECGHGILRRAHWHARGDRETQVFLDICCCRTLASILYEYEGWGTLISKVCIHFECLHVHFNPFFMSPFFKSPLKSPFSKVSIFWCVFIVFM